MSHLHNINSNQMNHIAGSISSPMSTYPLQSYHLRSTYFHQHCQWFFDPPPAKKLSLKIASEHETGTVLHDCWKLNISAPILNFAASDCRTWNASIAIWNSSFPGQMGTLIDRFCPENMAKEYSLNTTSRKIVIR